MHRAIRKKKQPTPKCKARKPAASKIQKIYRRPQLSLQPSDTLIALVKILGRIPLWRETAQRNSTWQATTPVHDAHAVGGKRLTRSAIFSFFCGTLSKEGTGMRLHALRKANVNELGRLIAREGAVLFVGQV